MSSTEEFTPTTEQMRIAWWMYTGNPADNEGESDVSFWAWKSESDRQLAATVRADQIEDDAARVRNEIRPPRPHRDISRSINDCDIIVNASLALAAANLRAQLGH